MRFDIRRVRNDEIELLCELDKKIFQNSDAFSTPDLWEDLEIFFITINDKPIGSIAFQHNSDVAESYEAEYPEFPGSLYLVTLGILPEWRGRGIGKMAKDWELRYARDRKFKKIVTNARASNAVSLRLKEKFGFKTIRTIPNYYEDPTEDAVVMERII